MAADEAKGITFNEAALLYCILGEKVNGEVRYPTINESLSYMFSPSSTKVPTEKKSIKRMTKTQVTQISFM